MSALGSGDDSVRAYHHVAVKVYINFQSSQDYEIQLVHICALIEGVRILGSGNLKVIGVFLNGLDGSGIEILGIHQRLDQPFLQKLAHGARNAAYAELHLDSSLLHDLAKGDGGSDGSSAYAGLIGKSILKVRSIDYKLGAVVRHHDLTHIGGGLCGASGDLGGISDLINHNHIVHIYLRDASGQVRRRNQAVGNGHYLIRVLSVYHSVGQNAAVALSAVGLHIAVLIAGRRADEGDINVNLSCLDGSHTSAVGTHDGQIL